MIKNIRSARALQRTQLKKNKYDDYNKVLELMKLYIGHLTVSGVKTIRYIVLILQR